MRETLRDPFRDVNKFLRNSTTRGMIVFGVDGERGFAVVGSDAQIGAVGDVFGSGFGFAFSLPPTSVKLAPKPSVCGQAEAW